MSRNRSLAAVLGRGLATAVLVTAVGIGCSLETSGLGVPADSRFDCSAWLESGGHLERVFTSDPEFSDRPVFNFCPGPDGTDEAPRDVWRRHLNQVLAAGPFRGHEGPWCVRALSCDHAEDFAEGFLPACPAPLGSDPLADCTGAPARCVNAAPEPVDFPATNISERSTATLSFENICAEPHLLRADETVFDDPLGEFSVLDNGCSPTTPDGRTLAALGSADDGCQVRLQFDPRDPGPRSAEYRTSVDSADMLTSSLQGEGVGGAPRAVDGTIMYCLDPVAPTDCAQAVIGIVTDGPGGFRVTTAPDLDTTRGDGFSVLPGGPTLGDVFPPGMPANFTVQWCRSAATRPTERAVLTVTVTTRNPIAPRTFEFVIEAPRSDCP